MLKKISSISLKNDFYPLLQLAIPLITVGLVQSGIGFFETLFLARLSPEILAAGALVAWLFGTLMVIMFGLFGAINVLISHHHGAQEISHITSVLRDGLVMACLLFIPTFLLLWHMPPLFLIFGQTPFVVTQAEAYLHPLAWALLPTFILNVFQQFLLGIGRARILMIFNVLATPLTILLSYVLIFGKWGFPALQIAGAGWGIMLSDCIAAIALLIYIFWNKDYKPYFKNIFHFKKPFFLFELLRVGLPIGLMYCVEVAFFFTMMLIMGTLGIQTLAANQIVFQYYGPIIGISFSIAQAITVRIGRELGAKNFEAAKRASIAGTHLTGFMMLIAASCYWFFPSQLIGIDLDLNNSDNKEIILYATEFFSLCAFSQFIEAIRISFFGALRALKDTHFTLITSIISFWGISLPSGYFLAKFYHLGGVGLWWGMLIGMIVSVLLLFFRLRKKMQKFLFIAS